MTREKIKLNYDCKKIVDEEDIRENRDIKVAEAFRIQAKFNSIKRKYMLLK